MKSASPPSEAGREPAWTSIIQPATAWWDLRLAELWRARDLVRLFVWRDFVAVYKQTVLGPLWYLIQPLLTTIVFTVVFGRIAGMPSDGVPHFAFYMAGTVMWTYFSNCLTKNSNTFGLNANLFGKVYFPRLAVPASVVISNLIGFGIQLLLLIGTVLWMRVQGVPLRPTAWIAAVPLLVVMTAALGAGAGLLVSAVTVRYRDLQQLVTFGVQLLMFATPVIYPLSRLDGDTRTLLLLNPLTAIIETFRYALLGAGSVSLPGLAYSAAASAIVAVLGAIMFMRTERTFVDAI